MSESKKNTRSERQAKVAQMQARERARARRTRITTILLVTLPALVLVTVVALVLVNSRPEAVAQALPPSVETEGGPFVVGDSDSAATLALYEDFQCPACQAFEAAVGPTVEQIAESDSARVEFHMLSFLDANLGNRASSQAIAAAAAADEQGYFLQYHAQVYANQGTEGTGFSGDQLEEFARAAGVPDLEKWRSDFESGRYADYITDVQSRANEEGVTSTPTVTLNGDDIRDQIATPQTLVDLVVAAGGTPVTAEDTGQEYDGETTDEEATVVPTEGAS